MLAGFVWGGGGGIASHSVVPRYLHIYGLGVDGLGFGGRIEYEARCLFSRTSADVSVECVRVAGCIGMVC